MSDAERLISVEQHRAKMQNALRGARMALMIVVDGDGELIAYNMNASPLETLGLRQRLWKLAGRLAKGEGEDDD